MKFLRNARHVAKWSEGLSDVEPVQRSNLGRSTVLYRSEAGEPIALTDVCLHRFAPLRLGSPQPGDGMQWPCHGSASERARRAVRHGDLCEPLNAECSHSTDDGADVHAGTQRAHRLGMDVRRDQPGCIQNFNSATKFGAPPEESSGIFGSRFMTPVDDTTAAYHFCAIRWKPRSQAEEVDAHIRQQLPEIRPDSFEFRGRPIIDARQGNILNPTVDTRRPTLFEINADPAKFSSIMSDLVEAEE